MNKRTVIEIEYHEIEKLVHDNFGKGHADYNPGGYSFIAVEKCDNDSVHQFCGITAKLDAADYFAKAITQFELDGTPGNLDNYQILSLLCKHGLIEPGDYLISVCW